MQEKYRSYERLKCKFYMSCFSFFMPNNSLSMHPRNFGFSIVTTFIKTPPSSAYDNAEKNNYKRQKTDNKRFRKQHGNKQAQSESSKV